MAKKKIPLFEELSGAELWQVQLYKGDYETFPMDADAVKAIIKKAGVSKGLDEIEDVDAESGVWMSPLPKKIEDEVMEEGYYEGKVDGWNIVVEMP